MAHETVIIQVFHLTAPVIRGPATRGERFNINNDRVAIKDGGVRGVLLCVQDYVRSPYFRQRSFLSDSGLAIFFESVGIGDSSTSSSIYAPWSLVGTECAGQVVKDQ